MRLLYIISYIFIKELSTERKIGNKKHREIFKTFIRVWWAFKKIYIFLPEKYFHKCTWRELTKISQWYVMQSRKLEEKNSFLKIYKFSSLSLFFWVLFMYCSCRVCSFLFKISVLMINPIRCQGFMCRSVHVKCHSNTCSTKKDRLALTN